ncbi:MAG: helical backbone metal receptor [Cytophagaceae bacterium]
MKLHIAFYLALIILLTTSCHSERPIDGKLVEDDLGRKVIIPHHPERILGLNPSSTEMLFAICPEENIVGRTQNCNYPEAAIKKPVVSNYPVDPEHILKINPDLIVAVEGIISLQDAQKIQQMGIPVYFQKFKNVEDVFVNLMKLGEITGNIDKANYVVDSLRKELQNFQINNPSRYLPKVLYLIWTDPIYAFGSHSIMTDKLRVAGAINIIDSSFKKESPELTREYILSKSPDVLLCGFDNPEKQLFDQYPEFRNMEFYRRKRVYIPTDDLQSRPGPRIVEAIKELHRLIHEE